MQVLMESKNENKLVAVGIISFHIILFIILFYNKLWKDKIFVNIFVIILSVTYIVSLVFIGWYLNKQYVLNEFIKMINEKINKKGMNAKEFKVSFDMDSYSFSFEIKKNKEKEKKSNS